MVHDAVILGAGPAGLAVAHALIRAGQTVKVVELTPRVGGSIRTIRQGEWLVEVGPNTLQIESPADKELLASYGLAAQMQTADMRSAKRYIFAHGKMHGLAASPFSLLKSDLLTWRGKLRLLSEVFRSRGGYQGETVEAFVARRFGAEAASLLMDPIVSGVHAGDSSRLVMENCFPKIHALEQAHRSVILGLKRTAGPAREIIGFPQGMQQLAEAMASNLPATALQLSSTVTLIRHDTKGWNIAWRRADGSEEGICARQLIVTAPHWHWPALPFDESIRPALREWARAEAPPVTVVARGYARTQVAHPLDGFGYLTPSSESRKVLGCIFPSTVLPHRTPEGKVLLCCFIGGARQPALARLADAALRELVDQELSETLGIKGAPEQEWIQRWERAIPQYGPAHQQHEEALRRTEASHPGLHFHGAFRGGIALMHVIRAGDALGRKLAES